MKVRLFCLPYAGAGASAYRLWRNAFGPDVDLRPLTLPGRESRLAEPPVIDPAEVAQTIAASAELPYAIYGHSMGGRLGFEVIRLLRERGAPLPVRFYAAACRPPDARGEALFDNIAGLPEPEFLDVMRAGGGVPEEVLAEPELLAVVLPALRADLAWLDRYAYTLDEPLPVPIVTFAGTHDPAVTPEEIAGWARHTSAGWRGHEVQGGHFFLHSHVDEVVRLIRADLLPAPTHRVPLGRTGWWVWKDALLRGTGFPADGLAAFTAPAAAVAADALLAADATSDNDDIARRFDAAFAQAASDGSVQARRIAADSLFREAVTWQSSSALSALDHLAAAPADERRNFKRIERETVLLRYWQRYCGKNDTIGFFGPCCWVGVDDAVPETVTVKPGAGLVRERRVALESWALAAFADSLAADPRIRRWLPVVLAPHLTLQGRTLLQPALPPLTLSPAEAAAVRLATGSRACDVVAALTAEFALHQEADGYLLLARLADRGLLIWGANLPVSSGAEAVLRERLAGIGDPEARAACLGALDRLESARDAVAAAVGDPATLRARLSTLDNVFTELTGLPPRRREGEMYAARALCYEDTERDLDMVFGRPLLDELAGPLSILLQAARWLTVALARAYGDALRELHADLASGGTAVRLADLWYFAQGSLWGSGERPVDAVAAEFAARWSTLFGLADEPVLLASADLAERVREAFPAQRPGWSAGALHSPDLHVCARDAEALARGEYQIVLGELHTSWPDVRLRGLHSTASRRRPARRWHGERPRAAPDPALVPGRLAPPQRSPHAHPARTDRSLPGLRLGARRAFRPPLPATSVIVEERDGELVAVAPDGHAWPVIEMFSALLSMHAVDGFKLVEAAPHTPRVTLDRMVVSRETWRTTVAATGLTQLRPERERYLAMRRWRARLGLPDRVYFKIGTEVKPMFADLTSPQHANSLCQAMRAAERQAGPDVTVVVTEMLPEIADAWVPDGAGHRYFSELRLHVVDEEAAHV
jgi:surfactin synthase thioesterase subunit